MSETVFHDMINRIHSHQEGKADISDIELQHMRNVLREQPTRFLARVAFLHQPTAERLYQKIRDMGTYIGLIDMDSQCENGTIDHGTFGVVYRGYRGRQIPQLYVSTASVQKMFGKISPLFSSAAEEQNPRHQTEAAVVTTSWMALGKWLAESLHPLGQGQSEGLQAGQARTIAKAVNVSPEKLMEPGMFDVAWDVLEFRMSGAMAYAGLADYITSQAQESTVLPKVEDIAVFQSMFYGFFYSAVANGQRASVGSMDYSLANPFLVTQLRETLAGLTPTQPQ